MAEPEADKKPGAKRRRAARLDSAETKLGQLAKSLSGERETTQTLSTAVESIRTDLAAARDELAAVKALAVAAKAAADAAKAAADALAARVDTAEPKLPVVLTLPDASIQPGGSAESAPASVTIPAAAKYMVVFQAAPNNTDRCQSFILNHNGGTYASGGAGGIDAKLIVRTMQLAAGAHTFAAKYYAAPPGGNNPACVVVSPLFWLRKL